MLNIVMEDMEAGEVAVMWQEGENALIMVTSDRSIPDTERCAAVNRLMQHLKLQPGTRAATVAAPTLRVVSSSAAAVCLFLPHLSQQMAGPPGKCLQALFV